MYLIALHMLFGDRAKSALLICALAFSSLLITQQGAVFCGLLRWTTALLRNTQAQIWVVNTNVEQVNEADPLRDTDLQRVRSVPGVSWAMPISMVIIQATLPNGNFKNVQLIGIDSSTYAGAPKKMYSGSFFNLSQSNSIIIDAAGVEKFSELYGRPFGIGDKLEINDREAVVVGICAAERSFFGDPYVYTTYDRALRYRPNQRKVLSYVICDPDPGKSPEEVARAIEKYTDLKAYTQEEFRCSTIRWFFINTGIPVSFGTTVLLGFIVGVAVAGQTFYMFILENLPHFGAMKAMGASNTVLMRMMLTQAFSVGFIGYGIGLGMTAIFGKAVESRGNPPFYFPDTLFWISFIAIIAICTFAVFLGVRRIKKIEPAEVFRT